GEGWVCINDLAFKKVEVIEVSGKEVTFLYSQQYKNGSATSIHGCTETWDVECFFWSDDSEDMFEYGLIIAANLTEGCSIHSQICSFSIHNITKTEIRTYLGVSRNVNLIISNQSIQVYDLETGFLLESEQSTSDGDIISTMSIVETNIFSTPTPPPTSSPLPENTAYDG
ncbi:MAG: hypothetical protein NWF10_06145, partial [Candidatus Bathyarchaeota archaeon]|nr:hypothetical protein [Candidatus Bathyarchaeota archaeon]